jgi:glycosyltransferase involved in cell wall biosynthesis
MVRGNDIYQGMKVLHIGHVPVPADHPDISYLPKYCFYPGRWVLNLAIAQKSHGAMKPEIIMQVPGASCPLWSSNVEGVPVHFVGAPTRLRASTLFYFDARRLVRLIDRIQPDFVHAHGTEEAAAFAAALSRRPAAVTFQGVFALMNKILPPRLISRESLQELAEKIAVRKLKHGIVKSDYGKREIAAIFPHLHLHAIPNTYIPPLVAPSFTKPADDIVFAGTIVPRKGVHVLVEAIRALAPKRPRLRLHMFGNKDAPGIYEETQLGALRSILGDRLILHGIAPKAELDATLAACRILAAPSFEEMFGNQVIEALLVGTHVVVSAGTPMEENVRRFGNGTVFAMGNAEELANAIESALDTYSARSAEAAIANIFEYMSPQRVAEKHLETYESIIREHQ